MFTIGERMSFTSITGTGLWHKDCLAKPSDLA